MLSPCCCHGFTVTNQKKTAWVCVIKPMSLEQVMSDRDSEDEVDDDVADLEDRQVLP